MTWEWGASVVVCMICGTRSQQGWRKTALQSPRCSL
jgi:hypothetical protein